MSDKLGITCCVLFLLLILVAASFVSGRRGYKPITDRCIINSPNQLIRGDIRFSPAQYLFYYKGAMSETREECEVRVRVTESEYERRMYGSE